MIQSLTTFTLAHPNNKIRKYFVGMVSPNHIMWSNFPAEALHFDSLIAANAFISKFHLHDKVRIFQ